MCEFEEAYKVNKLLNVIHLPKAAVKYMRVTETSLQPFAVNLEKLGSILSTSSMFYIPTKYHFSLLLEMCKLILWKMNRSIASNSPCTAQHSTRIGNFLKNEVYLKHDKNYLKLQKIIFEKNKLDIQFDLLVWSVSHPLTWRRRGLWPILTEAMRTVWRHF